MKRVSVTELKNRLSEYLRLVKKGETIEVLDRTVPVARIVAISSLESDSNAVLDRAVFEGVVTRAASPPDLDFLKRKPVRVRSDPVRALIDSRGDR
jgi:prevent-host-death family protein